MSDPPWTEEDCMSIDPMRDRRPELLNQNRLETMAHFLAQGRCNTEEQMKLVADFLGVDTDSIAIWKKRPKMIRRVRELVEAEALYATAEAIPLQKEKAKKSTAAFIAVAKVAQAFPQPGGVNIQNNVMNDNRRTGQSENTTGFIQRFRSAQSRGLFHKLTVIETDNSVEPSEPTDASTG